MNTPDTSQVSEEDRATRGRGGAGSPVPLSVLCGVRRDEAQACRR